MAGDQLTATAAPPPSAPTRLSRARSAVADVNRTRRPETDRVLRGLILGTVLVAVLAVAASGTAPPAEATAVLVLLPAGFWWSERQRASSNYVAKAIISVLALVVLARFFGGLVGIGSIDDARLPLTLLFLEIQVLHAFDLPQRRDLMFTLSSSLALVGLAVAGGPSAWLLAVVAVYLVLAGASLHRYRRSVYAEWAEGATAPTEPLPAARTGADADRRRTGAWRYTAAIAAIGALLFASVPLRSDASLGGLPASFGIGGPQGRQGSDRVGGDLPFDDSDGDGSLDTDPLEYFGFAERVDPGQVGELSDVPVLEVRTNRARPLRGVVFDLYADGVWGRTEDTPEPRQGLPIALRPPRAPGVPTERVTQTISLVRPTPNLVFGAGDPVEVWTAARSVTPWEDGTITTSVEMDPGTIYSVVSEIDVTPPERLAAVPLDTARMDPADLDRWTQLPGSVPDRVHDLAAELAARAPDDTPYAVAVEVQAHLGATVGYTLDVDPAPESADPVDHLLFESRAGWCEPIASAMVVLLRSRGIPARFVTGFQPGDRDLLSGRYTVLASDAHAWVEVLLPGHGWVPFDPTGATTPTLSPDGEGAQILLVDLARWLVDRLPTDPAVVAVSGAGLLLLVGAGWALRRRRAAARLAAAGPWAQLEDLLRRRGYNPPASATPAEVVDGAAAALPDLDPSALVALREHEERRRYGGAAVTHGEERDAAAAGRALAALRG